MNCTCWSAEIFSDDMSQACGAPPADVGIAAVIEAIGRVKGTHAVYPEPRGKLRLKNLLTTGLRRPGKTLE